MTCTDADFHRLMPMAFPGIVFDPARRCFTPPDGGWSLELGEPATRYIASLRLPVIDATFRFPAADADTVLATFFRYFQRGGG